MKTIGFLTVVAALAIGGLYYGGYIDGSVDINKTAQFDKLQDDALDAGADAANDVANRLRPTPPKK